MQNARERTSIPKWVEWGAIPLLCVFAGAALALLFSTSPPPTSYQVQQAIHFSVTERLWADKLDNHAHRVQAAAQAVHVATSTADLQAAAEQLEALADEATGWGEPPIRLLLLQRSYLRVMDDYRDVADAIRRGANDQTETALQQANDAMVILSEPILVVRTSS